MTTVRFNTQFPGYEILSELGRSNARILKARHLASGDLVAIKHFALNTDAETLRRFQRESAIMTSIAHPNIVRVRDVQLEAELPYLVMELIEGGTLSTLIKAQNGLDVPTTTRLGLQMAAAFRVIHEQGIIHRDVKPENILYRPLASGELHFLLTDFGVARLHEQSNTLTGQSLMTYEYASPEQFNDPKHVGPATDYYSLGVVLYECLTGRVPFAMTDHAGIVTFMNKVLTDAPPALPPLAGGRSTDGFATLLDRLLTKNPADRLSDPDELTWLLKQAELQYLQSGRAATASPPVAVPDTARTQAAPAPAPRPVQAAPPLADRPVPKRASWQWPVFIGIALLGLAGGYLVLTRSGNRSTTTDSPTDGPAPLVTGSAGKPDTAALHARQRLDSARAQLQRRQQGLLAARSLRASVANYKVGLFGGIKNAEIELTNPTELPFTYVLVQVNYYKEKGGLYKHETLRFANVAPNASVTLPAPNSDRGTRLTCRVTSYRSTAIPDAIDTMATASPLN